MNNYHPFLPRASNNISIKKLNDAVTWLKISMITSNILSKKSKGALNCTFTDTSQGFLMLTLSFVERKDFKDHNSLSSVCNEQHSFSTRNMFFNKGFFKEAINHHAIIPLLLSLCYALLSLTAILMPKLQSFLKFCHLLFFLCVHRRFRSCLLWKFAKKALNFFWLLSSKLPFCLRSWQKFSKWR